MDPNIVLENIRSLVARIQDDPCSSIQDDADSLASLIQSLDEWLMKGGFLPNEWAKNQPTNPQHIQRQRIKG
jgi:hypothetical protein